MANESSGVEMVDVPMLINALTKNHTKKAIADRVGKSWQTIYYWQRGVFKPSGESLKILWEMYHGDKSAKPEA